VDTDDTDDTDGTVGEGAAPVVNAPAPTLPTQNIPAPADEDDTTDIGDDPVPTTLPGQEQQETDEEEDGEVPLPVEQDVDSQTGSDGEVTIEDGETPLGLNENMEENTGKNLWWLSVIPVIAAGVAGKAGYDKKYKKGIFAGKQKKEDRNNTGK
jgi:hypothetical protein